MESRMTAVRQRIADWQRERRIARLTRQVKEAQASGCIWNLVVLTILWPALRDEINQRSPQQVARMERRRGLVR
jgi:hypothetical protein